MASQFGFRASRRPQLQAVERSHAVLMLIRIDMRGNADKFGFIDNDGSAASPRPGSSKRLAGPYTLGAREASTKSGRRWPRGRLASGYHASLQLGRCSISGNSELLLDLPSS